MTKKEKETAKVETEEVKAEVEQEEKAEVAKIKRVCKICGAVKYYPAGINVGCDKCNRIMAEVNG